MAAAAFVDTNVLLYAVSTTPAERSKRERAIEVLGLPSIAVSAQVLQEFYFQATRESRPILGHHEAVRVMADVIGVAQVVPTTVHLILDAVRLRNLLRISYWDAAIVAAAREAGASRLFSEDLAHGRSYDGVVVENPFARA